jgi:hypothetical protein
MRRSPLRAPQSGPAPQPETTRSWTSRAARGIDARNRDKEGGRICGFDTLIIPASLLATLGGLRRSCPATDERGFIIDLSPEVAALAAPNQNLNAVQFRPEDGCYWVQWDGPVETVMVPLRATEWRPGLHTFGDRLIAVQKPLSRVPSPGWR